MQIVLMDGSRWTQLDLPMSPGPEIRVRIGTASGISGMIVFEFSGMIYGVPHYKQVEGPRLPSEWWVNANDFASAG